MWCLRFTLAALWPPTYHPTSSRKYIHLLFFEFSKCPWQMRSHLSGKEKPAISPGAPWLSNARHLELDPVWVQTILSQYIWWKEKHSYASYHKDSEINVCVLDGLLHLISSISYFALLSVTCSHSSTTNEIWNLNIAHVMSETRSWIQTVLLTVKTWISAENERLSSFPEKAKWKI